MVRREDQEAKERALELAQRHRTLEDVVRSGARVVQVVTQDEYTHDVVVEGPVGTSLVYDTT
ncbi:MAG: hypothetical protein HYV07_04230 [Deltaproteobacteria bacterium]|nr:hypothetical protein [Deltaproteobacteria bacterium]